MRGLLEKGTLFNEQAVRKNQACPFVPVKKGYQAD
jgi:hypothetical protein